MFLLIMMSWKSIFQAPDGKSTSSIPYAEPYDNETVVVERKRSSTDIELDG